MKDEAPFAHQLIEFLRDGAFTVKAQQAICSMIHQPEEIRGDSDERQSRDASAEHEQSNTWNLSCRVQGSPRERPSKRYHPEDCMDAGDALLQQLDLQPQSLTRRAKKLPREWGP